MTGKIDIIGVIEGDYRDCYYDGDAIKNKHTTWHLMGGANTDHETLCGIDADDPGVGTFGAVNPKKGQKVACRLCINEFRHVKKMSITERDFEI